MKNGAFTWKTNAKPTPSLKKQTPRQNRTQKNDAKKVSLGLNDIGPQPHVLSDIDGVGRKLSSLLVGSVDVSFNVSSCLVMFGN